MEKLKSAWVFFVRCLLVVFCFFATNSHALTILVITTFCGLMVVWITNPITFFITGLVLALGGLYAAIHAFIKGLMR